MKDYYLFCKKIIKEHANYQRNKYEDRNVLEEIIFPYVLTKYEPKKILDIGREDYQYFYNEFFIDRELWTLDYNPKRVEFGAKKHIVDGAENIAKHFKINYFDFILMNGIIGWGLNDPKKIEKTIAGVYKIIKKNKLFIIGWNNTPDLIPTPLTKIKALKKFKKTKFPPLKSNEFECINGKHTYSFFIKE